MVFQVRDERVASWNLYRYTIDIPGREVDVQRFVERGFPSERREGSELESVSLYHRHPGERGRRTEVCGVWFSERETRG